LRSAIFLDRDRTFDCGDDRGKLQENAIARRLDQPPAEGAHDRRRRLAPLTDDFRRAGLVRTHHARIADHVGGEDRREAACRGHGAGRKGSAKPLSGALKKATGGSFVGFGMAARPCCTER
jgi:hypothetical protein